MLILQASIWVVLVLVRTRVEALAAAAAAPQPEAEPALRRADLPKAAADATRICRWCK